MKRLLFVAFLLIGATGAWGQPPQEIVATDRMQVRVQQTRTFRFDTAISRIALSAKEVAEVVPESDRTINVVGLAEGETLLSAFDANGQVFYRANIVVVQAGGFVKIYGQGKDFVSYYCVENGCGRADQDIKAPPAASTTISNTRTLRDGSSQTLTKEYR